MKKEILKIYYDSIQEGAWFKELHPILHDATLHPFPNENSAPPSLKKVLSYDRPDIILADDNPILVLERTVEVPSGHNVGQRFARLVAAAQMRIPILYFGPYAAYKHGGQTQGPRYMNLRLFYALSSLAKIENTAVTAINWPVDENYEIIKTPSKDRRLRIYLDLFFDLYHAYNLPGMLVHIMNSPFEQEQEKERRAFISREVVRPKEYDSPPGSVTIAPSESIRELNAQRPETLSCRETVLYKVGMTYIRSDPYTGMAMLYSYLYCGGLQNRVRNLVLHFPNITHEMWQSAVNSPSRKDVRLYKLTADGILFSNKYVPKIYL